MLSTPSLVKIHNRNDLLRDSLSLSALVAFESESFHLIDNSVVNVNEVELVPQTTYATAEWRTMLLENESSFDV